MGIILKLLLSTSAAVYFFAAPVLAMEVEDEGASTPTVRQPISSHLKAQLAQLYPHDFDTLSPAYMQAISSFRRARSSFKGTEKDVFFGLPNPDFEPVAAEMEAFLRSYLETHPAHQFTQKLLRELKFYREEGELNPSFLWGIPLRHAASRSHPTEDERDLFRNFPHPEFFRAPLENDAWRHMSSLWDSINDEEGSIITAPLPWDVITNVRDQMDRFFPFGIPVPVMGKGKLPLSMIVENLLDHTFLAGVPLAELTVHGIQNVSPYGFITHDLLHKRVDHRYSHLLEHILKRGVEHVAKGGDIREFIETYPEVACRRYATLMNSLRKVYETLLEDLEQDRNLFKFRKAMGGFFWVIHEARESSNFPSEIYETNNLEDILKTITGEDVFNEDYLKDPLKTNPVSGESLLSDKEIIDYTVADEELSANSSTHPYVPFVHLGQVERTPQFIRVTLKLSNGEDKVVSHPTLYYKWNEMDDHVALLSHAGVAVEKPNLARLESPDQQRDQALSSLNETHTILVNLVAEFQKIALRVVKADPQQDGNTLAKQYADQYHHQEQMLTTKLHQGIFPTVPDMQNYGNSLSNAEITGSHRGDMGIDTTDNPLSNEVKLEQKPSEGKSE